MLRLTTFGGVALRRDGGDDGAAALGEQALPRRGLALLVLLAMAQEAGMSRESLTAYLWPESDEERAQGALRQTIHALRRDLGMPDLLSRTGGVGLTLNTAVLTCDVREFDQARSSGDLERATRLYGGPFLDGFHLRGAPEFERWVDRQRAEYAARAAGVLEALAQSAGARGDFAGAAEWWRRLSQSDPLNTRYVLQLMAAEAAAGNGAAAIRHARAHEELVRHELGAAPDPALAALLARIRDGAWSVGRGSPAKETLADGPGPDATGRARPSNERERLKDLLRRELGDRYELDEEPESAREGYIRLLGARDRRYDRPVVLKVLQPALASRIDVERFIREIRLTGKLIHPHILPLLESGEVAGRPWYAVPRPEGETLRARLTREKQVPVDEALRLTRELADALGHAHAQGLVHRDVSPENVLLAGSHALLTNLGLARALDVAAGADLTVTGMVVGTPAYMSPEQAEGTKVMDQRTDVYSLAAVVFEMLLGEPLFSGPTPQAIMAKRAAEPTPPPERFALLTAPLTPVLRKGLAAKPAERFSSADAFASALRTEGADVPVANAPVWRRWLAWVTGRNGP